MCLVINTRRKSRVTKKPSKSIIGYKVVYDRSDLKYFKIDIYFPYISIFRKTPIRKYVNISNRKGVELEDSEVFFGIINKGFHFYRNLKDAICEQGHEHSCVKILKCEIQPEDFVAHGRTNLGVSLSDVEYQRNQVRIGYSTMKTYLALYYRGPSSFVATKYKVTEVVK